MTNPAPPKARPRVLVADDEDAVLRVTARILTASGYDVTTACDGQQASDAVSKMTFDAIVSDISMPGLDGIELLQNVRKRDLDVPVILVTGAPDVRSAARAVALGAHGYLIKPTPTEELREMLARAISLHQLARLKREALDALNDGGMGVADQIGLAASFDRAMETLWIAYQPLVRAADGSLYAYEALLRSNEASLPHPGAVIDAAGRLGRLEELGRRVRTVASQPMGTVGSETALFVNLLPRDLLDPDLQSKTAALSELATRVVLEITERESLDGVPDARARIADLRSMGFRIAIDDLGAGYAGLSSFAALQPEFAKIDMSLVRDVDTTPIKQKLIGSLAGICKDLGIIVVAEGIETVAERETVIALGCDLLQGYLLAKPGKAFPAIRWLSGRASAPRCPNPPIHSRRCARPPNDYGE